MSSVNNSYFQEKNDKNYFHYFLLDNAPYNFDLDVEFLKSQGCEHGVFVSSCPVNMSAYRGAIVKKTVAYIAVDEGDEGEAKLRGAGSK